MRFLSIGLLALLVSCQISIEPPPSRPPDPAPRVDVPKRPATQPELIVRNEAFGNSKKRLAFAIDELKRLGFWNDLTGHLLVLKLGSRLGLENVPQDEHLADASSTGIVEGDEIGALCDLMFYATAIRNDLERIRAYYAQGLADAKPATLSHYWVAILAHELTHCLPRAHGESAARKAEDAVREAYELRHERF
jgi:hypothetical protein